MQTLTIHPKAIIDPDAKLGEGVVVEAYAIIEKDVEIGDYTHIGYHSVIHSGARIGTHCKIGPGSCVAGDPQDLKYEGEHTFAYIGNHTTLREYITISRGTKATGATRIGDHCLLMAYVHIAHDCRLGDHGILSNAVQVGGHVEIGEYVTIGGIVGVHQFTKIGSHAMIAAGSPCIRKDVPPYVSVGKEPLRFCGLNNIGMQRRGISTEKIAQIKQIYSIIYKQGLNHSEAIAEVLEKIQGSEIRDYILDFIRSSDRGIIG